MSDSFMEEYLPFKSDPKLLDEYIFSNGKIRTGKLLEGIHTHKKKSVHRKTYFFSR
jgi:hypothetical protein